MKKMVANIILFNDGTYKIEENNVISSLKFDSSEESSTYELQDNSEYSEIITQLIYDNNISERSRQILLVSFLVKSHKKDVEKIGYDEIVTQCIKQTAKMLHISYNSVTDKFSRGLSTNDDKVTVSEFKEMLRIALSIGDDCNSQTDRRDYLQDALIEKITIKEQYWVNKYFNELYCENE